MQRRLFRGGAVSLASLVMLLVGRTAAGAPPVPSGAHPRLFMTADNLAGFTANAKVSSSATAQLIKNCQDTMAHPEWFSTRGGSDGDNWPAAAVDCALGYLATKNSAYLTQAIKYWRTSLNDDQDIGDNLGCVQGVDTNWMKTVNGNSPPVVLTVMHDTGYPMRWYGPYISLVYDWLNAAPGVDAALLAQTRTCLTAWADIYTAQGYHNKEAGGNYNAGYVIGKTLAAIAIGNDGGADGHLWNEVVTDLFPNLLIGKGLANPMAAVGDAAGSMVGGDWPEGWQYGPLSVLEYAVSTRAIEEAGMPLPEMDAWVNSMAIRYIYANVPHMDGQWVGGDFDGYDVYRKPSLNQFDAVLAGPSSDQAAGYMAFMKQQQPAPDPPFIYNALAELRTVTPQDYRAQTPPPSLWYIAHGTRAMYVRTSWDANAYWGVFSSSPAVVDDHEHWAAGNFVFTRGADHLIIDASQYGEQSTLGSNAVTADSPGVTGDYAPSQTPWSEAELVWARGTESGVYAARSDFAKAFIFTSNPSDVPYAHREWTFLPEGEVVTIDRVRTGSASRMTYLNFQANTNGSLKMMGGTLAVGTVGGSQVAIHTTSLSGGTPNIHQPPTGDCNGPWGGCDNVRFPVDEYQIKIPGPNALAINVFDGLASGEALALVDSMNDDNIDPAPKQNAGVIGAGVFRGSKQTFVVASSAQDGAAGATMTYGVPGGSAARHIVFDAPEDASGKSMVSAAAQGDRCVVTITAGSGFAGRPLMFVVSTAADGCTATEDVDVPTGTSPPGGGLGPTPTGAGGSGGGGSASGGCGCALGGPRGGAASLLFGLALAGALAVVRRRVGRARRPR